MCCSRVLQLGSNDDCPGSLTSCVAVNAVAGVQHVVQVDGYAGATGAVRVMVMAAGV